MPAMSPPETMRSRAPFDWASLVSEIGATFDDEDGGQVSVEEAKRLAPPSVVYPDPGFSSVADAVRENQANLAALVRAVQSLKLQFNQAAPNITMPKLDIPAPVVNVPAPVVNVAAPQMSRSGWRFEFVRGRDGLVESIRAIPE